MALDGSHDGEAELVEPVELADLDRQQPLDGRRVRAEVAPVDPHPDHLRPGVDPVLRLDRRQHVGQRRDVRGARPDDVAQDRGDAVRAAHHEQRLRRRAAVLEHRPRRARRPRRRRPSGSAGTRAPRGRRSRTRRTAGRGRGRRAAASRSVVWRATVARRRADGPRWPSGARPRPAARTPATRGASPLAGTRPPPRSAVSNGGPEHALVGHDAADEVGRRDVERRVADRRCPGGATRIPRNVRTSIGGALLDRDRPRRRRREVDRADRARTRRTGCRAARRARPACTSRPCWPCRRWRRSGPRRRSPRRPRRGAMRWPAATSGIRVCGTPACASSQAVSRAPCRYGRVSSTQTWSSRPA